MTVPSPHWRAADGTSGRSVMFVRCAWCGLGYVPEQSDAKDPKKFCDKKCEKIVNSLKAPSRATGYGP